MDTFIIFTVIFGLFGAMIWVFYNTIQGTYGKNSPLKVQRSYSISELKYFTKIDTVYIYYIIVISILILRAILISGQFRGNDFWPALAFLIVFVSFIICSIYFIHIDILYWKKTKGVTLHFVPDSKQIIFEFPDRQYIVSEGDIERIEDTTTGGKIRIGFTTYYLKNGDSFILTDRIGGQWAIRELFKHIPYNIIYKGFPPKL